MSEDSGAHGRDAKEGTITCDAGPVLCRIRPGRPDIIMFIAAALSARNGGSPS